MSQICTSRSQSERLLALGIKAETADMFYSHDKGEDIYAIRACWEDFWSSKKLIDGHIRRHCIPAWSLHRLIELLQKQVYQTEDSGIPCDLNIHYDSGTWLIVYICERDGRFKTERLDLIDALYDMIVKLKEEGVI